MGVRSPKDSSPSYVSAFCGSLDSLLPLSLFVLSAQAASSLEQDCLLLCPYRAGLDTALISEGVLIATVILKTLLYTLYRWENGGTDLSQPFHTFMPNVRNLYPDLGP